MDWRRRWPLGWTGRLCRIVTGDGRNDPRRRLRVSLLALSLVDLGFGSVSSLADIGVRGTRLAFLMVGGGLLLIVGVLSVLDRRGGDSVLSHGRRRRSPVIGALARLDQRVLPRRSGDKGRPGAQVVWVCVGLASLFETLGFLVHPGRHDSHSTPLTVLDVGLYVLEVGLIAVAFGYGTYRRVGRAHRAGSPPD